MPCRSIAALEWGPTREGPLSAARASSATVSAAPWSPVCPLSAETPAAASAAAAASVEGAPCESAAAAAAAAGAPMVLPLPDEGAAAGGRGAEVWGSFLSGRRSRRASLRLHLSSLVIGCCGIGCCPLRLFAAACVFLLSGEASSHLHFIIKALLCCSCCFCLSSLEGPATRRRPLSSVPALVRAPGGPSGGSSLFVGPSTGLCWGPRWRSLGGRLRR